MERSTSIRDGLKQGIADIKTHAAADAVIASPANSLGVFRLDKALEVIVTHQERHLAQAKETLAPMGFRSRLCHRFREVMSSRTTSIISGPPLAPTDTMVR